MNRVEVALFTLLLVCVVFSWYYALFVLPKEKSQTGYSTDGFPVEEWAEITAADLGTIEANITGLIRVIVAAHQVEEPKEGLREAVKKNLANNVEYHFLVSKCHAESEIDGWVRLFLAMAHVVQKRAGSPYSPHDLIRISSLSYDWRDTPYLFYQTETSSGELATIAFRGNQTDEGIAERYTRLPGWLAYSLGLAILSDAPHPMSVQEVEFNRASGVKLELHVPEMSAKESRAHTA